MALSGHPGAYPQKWINGTRTPMLHPAPVRHFAAHRCSLPSVAWRPDAGSPCRGTRSSPSAARRPRKGTSATRAENAPQAPESPDPEIPAWLSSAV